MNLGICPSCGARVPAHVAERDGRVFLVRNCADCGRAETLIARDGAAFAIKRRLDLAGRPEPCDLDCLRCPHGRPPRLLFLNVTSRCNMSCPICMDGVPDMRFVFEPPLDYFRPILEHFARLDPRPSVDLFGGEPTLRDDLFRIIELVQSYGFTARVVTNGLRLANPDYCRRLVGTGAVVLFSYDGAEPVGGSDY